MDRPAIYLAIFPAKHMGKSKRWKIKEMMDKIFTMAVKRAVKRIDKEMKE